MANFFVRASTSGPTSAFFKTDELDAVHEFYRAQGDAPPTPLRRLPGLAASLGLGEVLVKDESQRFGLPAFKITGTRYAVARLIDSRGSAVKALACATAGNHGRAVARSARLHGLASHIYVPAGTTPARIEALQSEGADVVVTDVDYDATVRLMAREADARGWTIVSDTAWDGYEQIPRWIMAGYTWIFEEAAVEWADWPPDVVIVQAGVGSLAGAAAGWLHARFGVSRPRLVIAEPIGSNCVLASLDRGRRVTLPSCAPTAMVGLRCAEVSSVAWEALRDRVDAAIAVPEALNEEAMQRLARPASGADPAIMAGASGTCGIAALLALMRDPHLVALRRALGFTPATRVLTIVTEGRTSG